MTTSFSLPSTRTSLVSILWDLYKDVTGVRPRHMLGTFESAPIEELQETVRYMSRELEMQLQEEQEEARREEQELVNLCTEIGCTREDYTRWMEVEFGVP